MFARSLVLVALVAIVLPALAAPEPPAGALPGQVERWLDSVVMLVTGPAWCSGVVIDEQGTVLTAYHCVANGRRPHIVLRDGTRVTGRTTAMSPSDDLALVAAPDLADKVRPLPIREDAPRQGEHVYGMGHPFAPAAEPGRRLEGMLRWSVTEGIVSAVGPRLVQTDTALNPGNSGGPVVDTLGRVVGIASRKLKADNIGFLVAPERIRQMVAHPKKPSLLGGYWTIGSSLLFPSDVSTAMAFEVRGGAEVRDRLIAQLGADFPRGIRTLAMQSGEVAYPLAEGTLGCRQRIGHGTWSTAVDVGGGGLVQGGMTAKFDASEQTWTLGQLDPTLRPLIYGRVGLAGVGVRMSFLPLRSGPPDVYMALDLDLPGTVGTF